MYVCLYLHDCSQSTEYGIAKLGMGTQWVTEMILKNNNMDTGVARIFRGDFQLSHEMLRDDNFNTLTLFLF